MSASVSDLMKDEQAIRELVATWITATKAGELATVLDLMTDNVIFSVVGAAPFGKNAFAAASENMNGLGIDGHYEIQEIEVHGDIAFMRNHLHLTVTPPGGAPTRRSGYTLTVLRKNSGGRWQIARDANLMTTTSV